MNPEETSVITYQAVLPLGWSEMPSPSSATQALWRQSNLALLRGLATIESFMSPESEPEASPAVAKALERVEAKLDITLGLLARLLAEQAELPPALPVVLSARRLSWQVPGRSTWVGGTELLLQLYLSPRLPEPLRLWARITNVEIAAEETHYSAELLDTEAEFDEWLTRTLFRYHRRALQARHYAG